MSEWLTRWMERHRGKRGLRGWMVRKADVRWLQRHRLIRIPHCTNWREQQIAFRDATAEYERRRQNARA